MRARPVWVPFICLFAGACAEDSEEESVAEEAVSGTLGGVAWEPAASEVWSRPLSNGPNYEVYLYTSMPAEPCTLPRAGEPLNHVLFRFPSSVGTYVLEDLPTVAIWITSDNSPAGRGRFEINDVAQDRIQGGVVAEFGTFGKINGTFDLTTFCGDFPF